MPTSCRLRGVSSEVKRYTGSSRAKSALPEQREHVALLGRNAPLQRVEIDLPHRLRSAALDHGQASLEPRRKARPCRAKTLLYAARAPFLGALADLVGREEPARLCAGQLALVGIGGAMCQSDAHRAFHLVTKMTVQLGAQCSVAGHSANSISRICGRRPYECVVV